MVLDFNTAYLMYKCDVWHYIESYDLIAVCNNAQTCIGLAKQYAKDKNEPMNEECIAFFEEHLQTQHYTGEGEFIIEKQPLNVLL